MFHNTEANRRAATQLLTVFATQVLCTYRAPKEMRTKKHRNGAQSDFHATNRKVSMTSTQRFENGFSGRVAVVTGGGTGMGRELVRQLAAAGCDVAMCDVMTDNLADTEKLCAADGGTGAILSFVADVSHENQIIAFRDAVLAWRPEVHLLFNNAGISGGGSFVHDQREEWDKTFAVCWNGVYFTTRAFMPSLLAAPIGHIINTSSVNGMWAALGPTMPHTAYSAAKFAVKGFTEALITDFRVNAPHLRASVVMPGWIGTSIVINSMALHGADNNGLAGIGEIFRDNAPVTAATAAAQILAAVQRDDWRILIGEDATRIDEAIRTNPNNTFEFNPYAPS